MPQKQSSEEDSADAVDSSDSDEVAEDYLANLRFGSDNSHSDDLKVWQAVSHKNLLVHAESFQ